MIFWSVIFVFISCQILDLIATEPVLSNDASGKPFYYLSFLTEPDPPRPSQRPPLHVAHCITGKPRTLVLPSVYSGYKAAAIDTLEAESKLFYVLSKTESRAQDRYGQVWEKMRPEQVVWITEGDIYKSNLGPRCLGYRRCKQFLKMAVCFELVRRYEREKLMLFSHILLARPDVFLPRGIGPARLWRTDMAMTPFYEFGLRGKDLGLENVSIATPIYVSWPENRSHSGVCDVVNIVPRGVAHDLFASAVEVRLRERREEWNGDDTWRVILDGANLTLSHHGIDYRIIRHGPPYHEKLDSLFIWRVD